ncbi:uncharacterized protein G2W53_026858 [Senna tora]|uniref:Uncharacterized protein n=1 Tax=Senna tora TaxID=362788 RepID=A0A834WHU3_9FABA|nr:uncharacterized protein G2W53_026858 [Senna tora]
MKAGVGSRPSQTWRSLLASREFLREGIYKLVGDGNLTLIWPDLWAGTHSVSINGVTIVRIRCIPLTRTRTHDAWAWKDEANGTLSVKSCYKMATKELWEGVDMVPNLFCLLPSSLWKSIWYLPLLSRYTVFLWRACRGIIPTIEALNHRGLEIDENCLLCGSEEEDVYHALVDCSRLKQEWDEARYNFASRFYHSSLIEWMVMEWLKWSEDQRCHFVIALYRIGECRNRRKVSQEASNFNGLWNRVERCWNENVIARALVGNDLEVPSILRWEKPRFPYIKLNVDAAMKENRDRAIGGVLRDWDGLVTGAFISSTPNLNDVVVVGALAVEKGMKVAREAGMKDIIVNCDSRLVVDMLNARCNHTSLWSSVCTNILNLSCAFNDVIFRWIPRVCNKSADVMSRVAKNSSQDTIWTLSVPLCLADSYIEYIT